ncbi:hypothetical protein GOD54_21375 [Sinorhizobium medicae]|nr:hypothetical protein [Sinorhizobium medicae]
MTKSKKLKSKIAAKMGKVDRDQWREEMLSRAEKRLPKTKALLLAKLREAGKA